MSDKSQTDADALILKAKKAFETRLPEAFLCRLSDTLTVKRKKAFLDKVRLFVQSKDVAFVIEDNEALAEKCDGIHIAFGADIAALRKKFPDMALGVVCKTRHEAMIAGEKGADYVAFEGKKAAELCAWWAELFTVPCVAVTDEACESADFVAKTLS